MSLIYCPECSTQVSEHAKACPKCAYPISNLNFKQASGNIQQSNTTSQTTNNFNGLDEYYREQFEEIQKTNEEYRGRYNWYAFWFSWIWLLTKGAWGWAAVVFLANWLVPLAFMRFVKGEVGLILGLLMVIGIASTLARNATKIYYNVRVKNKQF